MGKKFRCKIGIHSYELMDKNFVKTCVFCGAKNDPNAWHRRGSGDPGVDAGM